MHKKKLSAKSPLKNRVNFTSRVLFLLLCRIVRSLSDVSVVFAPSVEEDDKGVDQEEEDKAKDEDLLNMDGKVRSVDDEGRLCDIVFCLLSLNNWTAGAGRRCRARRHLCHIS